MRNLILIMLLPLALPMFSQYQIIVQGNGETSLYENFTDAVTNSVNGDTIYLPGMNSTGLNVTINKR